MAKASQPTLAASRTLDKQALSNAIRSLQRRIEELNRFDFTSAKRYDPRVEALATKVDATIAEIFGHDTPEYGRYSVGSFEGAFSYMEDEPRPEQIQSDYQQRLSAGVTQLESIRDLLKERLEDLNGADTVSNETPQKSRPIGNRVFVVHGHDEAAKESVARFIEQLNLTSIILHEQASGGRTIIEKLEGHLNVDFAVVLLTPDDNGGSIQAGTVLKARARQNVILELGIFLGALGRKKVCALHKGEIELPSDYNGVVFVPMDPAGGWRLLLAREMRAAGLRVDLNRAV